MTITHPPQRAAFPNMGDTDFEITSPCTTSYNCICWATSASDRWWWPDTLMQTYWPPNIPREETIDAFVAAYAIIGFLPCPDGSVEAGFEKIVIYAKSTYGAMIPTHAARQLENGEWTSKLGQSEDISHRSEHTLAGPGYGQPLVYMRRPRVIRQNPSQ